MDLAPEDKTVRRLVTIAFLLLWPPFLILFQRESGDAQIYRWSTRVFAVLVAYGGGLAIATIAVVLDWRSGKVSMTLSRIGQALKNRPLAVMVMSAIPIVGLVGVLVAVRVLGVVPRPALLLGLLNIALVVLVLELIFWFAGRTQTEQRQLTMKICLSAFTFGFALVAVELAAASLGIGRYVTWNINPKNLDTQFRTDDFDVHVVTNEQGLRVPVEVSPDHPGVFRIITIGDSMTFGWGAESDATYSSVAESQLRAKRGIDRIEIINMGRPGAAPHEYLQYLAKYASRLQPDLIVVGFLVGNDCPVVSPASLQSDEDVQNAFSAHVSNAESSWFDQVIQRSLLMRLTYAALASPSVGPSTPGEGKRGPIFGERNPLDREALNEDVARLDNPESAKTRIRDLDKDGWIEKGLNWDINPWLVRSIILNPGGAADSLAARPETRQTMEYEWKLCERLLLEMQKITDQLGIKLVVLAIPNAHLVSEKWVDFLKDRGCIVNSDMTQSDNVNRWLGDFCRRNDIPCIDPLDQFREQQAAGRDLYLRTDDHMTSDGYRLLGESLADGLAPIVTAELD